MKSRLLPLAAAVLSAGTAVAQETRSQARTAPQPDPALAEVLDVVDRTLKAADLGAAGRLLGADLPVLESGSAQRSRSGHLAHHVRSDAAFLRDATVTTTRRHGRVHGAPAWAGSESETRAGEDAAARTLRGTETMILQRRDADWRIVHIHGSPRPEKA